MSQNIEQDGLYYPDGTYKERDKWASQSGIGGRGQQGGIALMLYPGERRMEAFKDIETAVDLMTDYV